MEENTRIKREKQENDWLDEYFIAFKQLPLNLHFHFGVIFKFFYLSCWCAKTLMSCWIFSYWFRVKVHQGGPLRSRPFTKSHMRFPTETLKTLRKTSQTVSHCEGMIPNVFLLRRQILAPKKLSVPESEADAIFHVSWSPSAGQTLAEQCCCWSEGNSVECCVLSSWTAVH